MKNKRNVRGANNINLITHYQKFKCIVSFLILIFGYKILKIQNQDTNFGAHTIENISEPFF